MTGSVKTSFTNHFSQYSFEKMQSFSGVLSQLNFCLKYNEIYNNWIWSLEFSFQYGFEKMQIFFGALSQLNLD